MPGFVPQWNCAIEYWDGDETGAPLGDPKYVGVGQVLKTYVPFNDWQRNRYGDLFLTMLVNVTWFPQDRIEAANGKGGFINIKEGDNRHFYVVQRQPFVRASGPGIYEVIAWKCILALAVDVENPA